MEAKGKKARKKRERVKKNDEPKPGCSIRLVKFVRSEDETKRENSSSIRRPGARKILVQTRPDEFFFIFVRRKFLVRSSHRKNFLVSFLLVPSSNRDFCIKFSKTLNSSPPKVNFLGHPPRTPFMPPPLF